MKKKLIIEGMSCGHCVGRVEKALNETDGIVSATVDLSSKSAIVELEKAIEDQQLIDIIDEAGYDVVSVEQL